MLPRIPQHAHALQEPCTRTLTGRGGLRLLRLHPRLLRLHLRLLEFRPRVPQEIEKLGASSVGTSVAKELVGLGGVLNANASWWLVRPCLPPLCCFPRGGPARLLRMGGLRSRVKCVAVCCSAQGMAAPPRLASAVAHS